MTATAKSSSKATATTPETAAAVPKAPAAVRKAPAATRKTPAATRKTAAATPMMAQYLAIKAANPDCLLFYRMGDFYELFFADAEIAAKALGIALTRRGQHLGADIPMCGVPAHSHLSYLRKLVSLGHRVAVCEQSEPASDAKKRGPKAVVRRDVVRLVTAGTLTEDDLLEGRAPNILLALAMLRHDGTMFGLAYGDISTGMLRVRTVSDATLNDELGAIAPAEIVVCTHTLEFLRHHAILPESAKAQIAIQPDALFATDTAGERISTHIEANRFDATTLPRVGRAALAAFLSYAADTQKGAKIPWQVPATTGPSTMTIDAATRASLELMTTIRGERTGALLETIDRCKTGPGSRLLGARLAAPLCAPETINKRLDAVAVFFADTALTARLRTALGGLPDLARALARLSLGRGGPRDLAAIAKAVSGALQFAKTLDGDATGTGPLAALVKIFGDAPEPLAAKIIAALQTDLPQIAAQGGFIRPGHNRELDAQRELAGTSRQIIADLQGRYQDETGIRALKIKHNNVLGYFAELSATHGQALMADAEQKTFVHRQTMANAMRFTTLKLGELESAINQASEKALQIELDLFENLRQQVLDATPGLQSLANALAEIDLAVALGHLAAENGYCRPKVDDSRTFDIMGGRHPVVEGTLQAGPLGPFVANDCHLGPGPDRDASALWLLTGPNMGGKSTFLRQNALIAILAQMGGFVPAISAHIGVVDRVFSRVGAADDIASGRSTFMVEMIETAAILDHATSKSLVILDEIGRGTSTFDGLSIAWACVEALADNIGCRTLFATHYHEMTALPDTHANVFNHTLKVREHDGEVIFLHEVTPGAALGSYGIQVARLAGLPDTVVARARQILGHLESGSGAGVGLGGDLPLFAARPTQKQPTPPVGPGPLARKLATIDPDQLTPREAIDLVYELKALGQDPRS